MVLEQYGSLKQTYETFKSVSGVQRISEERDRYMQELKALTGGGSPSLQKFSTDEEKYLKAKNFHYETLVERLERERAELQMKLAVSQEQSRLQDVALVDREKQNARQLGTLKRDLHKALY